LRISVSRRSAIAAIPSAPLPGLGVLQIGSAIPLTCSMQPRSPTAWWDETYARGSQCVPTRHKSPQAAAPMREGHAGRSKVIVKKLLGQAWEKAGAWLFIWCMRWAAKGIFTLCIGTIPSIMISRIALNSTCIRLPIRSSLSPRNKSFISRYL